MKKYQILLYYLYTAIDEPELFASEHLAFCKSLGLLGRIIVSHEGINGTVSGTVEATEKYMSALRADPRFKDIEFKIDPSDGHVFKKMFVRHKKEIVNMSLEEDINPRELTGNRLSPKEFYEMLNREDVIVIDGRNDYEYEIGHFRNAIRPDVKSFREFPDWIQAHKDELTGKTVLTYCTGGIRCEKLSGFLLREGIDDVYQLHGGIVTYGKDPEVQGRMFDGKCYVFDERIAVRVNQTEEDVVVSRCTHCNEPSDRYINCGYLDCHRQHICCESCENMTQTFCTPECKEQAIREDRVDPLVQDHIPLNS